MVMKVSLGGLHHKDSKKLKTKIENKANSNPETMENTQSLFVWSDRVLAGNISNLQTQPKEKIMTAAIIGGMDRLQPHYQKEAKKAGYKLKMFTGTENTINERIRNIDLLIIFTGKVSHCARKSAMNAAKAEKIPVMMCHSCGVSTLRECLENKNCPVKQSGRAGNS